MESNLNIGRLSALLANLHEITRLQISLHEPGGREIHSVMSRSAFCDLICGTQEGRGRCLASDRQAVAAADLPLGPVQNRCHAGLIETVIPITEHGRIIAVILFGQILDDSPLAAQWDATRALCAWHPDGAALERAFFALPRLSARQIRACYQIINACVSEIRLEGLLKGAGRTDAERLSRYLDEHFAQSLTLTGVARALSISKSKLCALAGQAEPGLTLTGMIARRRVEAAKRLLLDPALAVRDVAERVGIPDYNYFTKVFLRVAGVTPSRYRRER